MTKYDFVGDGDSDFRPDKPATPWESYANHRGIVTGFIKSICLSSARSLCVLGAGYCFDIDLKHLLDEFDEIALVDISQTDIDYGLAEQNVSRETTIETLSGFDVTGVDSLMDKYATQPTESLLEEILASLGRGNVELPKHYDCIASTCLLSQLLYKATSCIGESHERFVEVLQAVRLSHIRLLVDSLNKGGTGILFTDFVSSDSLPELLNTDDLEATLQSAIVEKNFLHGLNPPMVAKVFEHPDVRDELTGIKVTDPWRWVTGDKVYACFAIVFHKK